MPGTELGQTTRTFNKGSGSGGDVTFYAERPGYSLWCDGGPRLSFTGGQAIDWEVYPYYDIRSVPQPPR